MAYIDTNTVKEIRTKINETFKKDGFKFSVTRLHFTQVVVVCLKSPLMFSAANVSINDHYTDSIENENERVVFSIINKIINKITGGQIDRNAGDMGADYCDCNFYKCFSVGKWNQPCEFINN